MVKAQVPTGKRGKVGGIKLANDLGEARNHARNILGMDIAGHSVGKVLIEQRVAFQAEYYAAVMIDPLSKGPLVLFSAAGGMDVEEAAEMAPDQLRRKEVNILNGFGIEEARRMIDGLDLGGAEEDVAAFLTSLYEVYRARDAELIEINPLGNIGDGRVLALDCKFVFDDQAAARHDDLVAKGTPDKLTALEQEAKNRGLKYIELSGKVGILANGAGLTMTTMDAVTHFGGTPANFLEIGGDAYTKGRDALEIVLANPAVKCLLVNFCGAFARTDVMAEGLAQAWEELKPNLPIFFTIHGTGEEKAVKLVRERLGVEPFDLMDDAVVAAVAAAK
jgi:succinyl-CoA synthetase beta subunit